MLEHELPAFVIKGTFTWTRRGYHYSDPLEIDLLAPQTLASDNHWLVVAAILEHAKSGNHSLVRDLKKWFRISSPTVLDRVCNGRLAAARWS